MRPSTPRFRPCRRLHAIAALPTAAGLPTLAALVATTFFSGHATVAAAETPGAPRGVTILQETLDRYEPSTGAYLGTERTTFAADGRRLRWEILDAEGATELLFFVRHDERGRESEAIYFEGDATAPSREVFTYSDDDRIRTTHYFGADGRPADRTEVERDASGRDLRKEFFNAKGQRYGEEDVLWNPDGTQRGWDFRYTRREGGASFRYGYRHPGPGDRWTQRVRLRDGEPEWIEARTIATLDDPVPRRTPLRFADGRISSTASESSPSFSADGRTMVFARYEEDWTVKHPHLATLEDGGWRVEPLDALGEVYNLAISPDGNAIVYAKTEGESRILYRIERTIDVAPGKSGWSEPENLSERVGLRGAYPCLTENGDLLYFDADGANGRGVYVARRRGDGFGAPTTLHAPEPGTTFDAWALRASGPILVTRCADDVCEPGPENGVFELSFDDAGTAGAPQGLATQRPPSARRIEGLPYVWGVQPVPRLGLLVFTDGEDILAVPLRAIPDLSTGVHSRVP